MGEPNPETEPATDPTAEELAALRKEKADRDAADKAAKDKASAERDAELAALRKEKADRDAADAKKVTAPKRKADKPAAPAEETPEKPKRSRVSRRWFGDQADD